MALESERKNDFKGNVPNIIKSDYLKIVEFKSSFLFFCHEVNDLRNFKKSYFINSALKTLYKMSLYL